MYLCICIYIYIYMHTNNYTCAGRSPARAASVPAQETASA